MKQTLSQSAFSALRWNYLGFVVRSSSNFIVGIFLARLLGPKPFGQLAAAILVVGIANVLADAGFTNALVQAPSISPVQIRYIFTIQFVIAILLTLACAASGGFVAASFHDPAIQKVIWGISPIFIFQALGQTANGILRRGLDFRRIQTAQVCSYLFGYLVVGIPAACLGAGVWSLIAAQLLQAGVYSIWLYLLVRHSLRPSLHESGKSLLRFGSKVTVGNIVNWGISNLDNLVVGRAFGSTNLGFYSRAFTLASAPSDGIVSTVQQVLFASCSRAEGRLEPIRRAYLACLSGIACVIFPSFWAMSVCAQTVMIGLYGDRWRPAVSLFQPLALAVSINAVMAVAGPILGATDKVWREINAQSLSLFVALCVFLITAHFSTAALAWGVVGVYIFRFIASTRPTLEVLSLRWLDVIQVLTGPVVAAVSISTIIYFINQVIVRSGAKPLLSLVLVAVSGLILGLGVLFLWGNRILAPELIDFIRFNVAGAPVQVNRLLERLGTSASRPIRGKQDLRETANQGNSAAPVFIATIMGIEGETGVHTHFNTLLSYLKRRSPEVAILTPFEAPQVLRRAAGLLRRAVKIASPPLSQYVRDALYQSILQYRMRSVLPADRPWIVYAQCPLSARAALSVRKRADQQVVLAVHFNVSQAEELVERGIIVRGDWVYRTVQRNESRSLLAVDRVLYVSEFMKQQLCERIEGLKYRPSLVAHNFILPPAQADGSGSGDLVTIGTLEPRKNHEFLLRVLAAAKNKGKVYSLTIFGVGPLDQYLRQLAIELNIADQVHFAGFVTRASERLHGYRMYVHAAKMENCGISLLEAQACGLPVIASRVGGTPEIVTEGKDGFFWNLDDPDGGADIIISVLEEETLRQALAQAALHNFAEKFSADTSAPAVVNFIYGGSVATGTAQPDSLEHSSSVDAVPLIAGADR